MRTARVDKFLGRQLAARGRSTVEPSEHDETVPPIREVEEATKLVTLRAAAQLGVSAFDRGEFKEFADASSGPVAEVVGIGLA